MTNGETPWTSFGAPFTVMVFAPVRSPPSSVMTTTSPSVGAAGRLTVRRADAPWTATYHQPSPGTVPTNGMVVVESAAVLKSTSDVQRFAFPGPLTLPASTIAALIGTGVQP